jgi:hypothetical protein
VIDDAWIEGSSFASTADLVGWLAWLGENATGDEPENDTEAPPQAGLWSDLVGAHRNVGQARDWFAEGAIEGSPIVMLSGPEKSHKSWVAIQLAAATTAGGSWLGAFAVRRPGSVVYLDGEYGEHEFSRRVARLARGIGARPIDVLGSIRHLYSSGLTLVDTDATFARVLADVRAHPPSLVVLDPLRNHLDGSENDADAIVRAYRCLDLLRVAGGCPVLVLHHLNKSGGSSGSRAIATRGDLLIEGSDGDAPIYSVRGRTVRPTLDLIAKPFGLEISHVHDHDDTIAATHLVHRLDGSASSAPLPAGLSPIASKVLTFLRDQREPRSVSYIAKALKRSKGDVADALEDLWNDSHADRYEDGVTFQGRAYEGWSAAPTGDGSRDDATRDVPRSSDGTTVPRDRETSSFDAGSTGDGSRDEQGTKEQGTDRESP